MEVRIGELLVQAGVLTDEQCAIILERQQQSAEPFGLICERLFGVDPGKVEDAWAQQYASLTRLIDPEVEDFEPRALDMVTRRQAWQFRVLPIRFDGDELMMATTPDYLRRALRFATRVVRAPTFLVMTDVETLGEALCAQYPLPGMTPDCVTQDGLDRLLRK
ncbi:MAG: hypothetical protein ACYTGC_01730 [Planctomycetota bacterium]|jgi:hypothetical protein